MLRVGVVRWSKTDYSAVVSQHKIVRNIRSFNGIYNLNWDFLNGKIYIYIHN